MNATGVDCGAPRARSNTRLRPFKHRPVKQEPLYGRVQVDEHSAFVDILVTREARLDPYAALPSTLFSLLIVALRVGGTL